MPIFAVMCRCKIQMPDPVSIEDTYIAMYQAIFRNEKLTSAVSTCY